MPWMVAATVRSLAHLRSLKEYKTVEVSTDEAGDGETTTKLEFDSVHENRFTGTLIHSLIGGAVIFCRPLLRQIPVSVLTGLFLYLGISSIGTTDLWDRFLLFLSDDKDVSKKTSWHNIVTLGRTKVFTAIQLALLGAMLYMKGTKLGVFFPVLIGLLAPVRIALEKWNIFSTKELDALDGEIA
jgi:hypothetical protein